MTVLLLLKVLHVLGAAILLGTGTGIAFFMLMAHRSGDARLIAHTAGIVVLADMLFTATAVVFQPVTGAALAWLSGQPLSTGWISASLGLYAVVVAFWLPVVWMQWRMRDLACGAALTGTPLPVAYFRLWRRWFAFGFPAFITVVAILFLMIGKPDF